MKRWLARQFGGAVEPRAVTVVLDPDRLLTAADLEDLSQCAPLLFADDWRSLRIVWDLEIRDRADPAAVIVIVQSEEFAQAHDLPWDVEREADVVVRIRWPVPPELRPAFRHCGEHADALAEAALTPATADSILATAFGFRPGNAAEELDSVVSLRLDPATTAELWQVLEPAYVTPLARAVARDRGNLGCLQDAWTEWLRLGDASPWAEQLRVAPGPMLRLLGAGLLSPAPATATGLPNWVAIGTAEPDADTALAELLASQPTPVENFQGWVELATWWAQVRALLASQALPPASQEQAWQHWSGLDQRFLEWLTSSYGVTVQASPVAPKAVHQIAPFLARRVEDGARVLLIVIDGLGLTQWHQLRSSLSLRVEQSTAVLAMLPTLTSVSRQAILAGTLPVDFADTIDTTAAEERRWRTFWAERRLNGTEVDYRKIVGRDRHDVPELAGRAVAVVVTAVDEILHGADVLGDRQVAAALALWAQAGFLSSLIASACERGFEVWITSDHGNLPTTPRPAPRQGQLVEAAGTRVRIYSNEALRSQAREHGIIWDPPGYPRGVRCPLFARGREGFHSSGERVTHGGLSLDEVLVPLAKVTT